MRRPLGAVAEMKVSRVLIRAEATPQCHADRIYRCSSECGVSISIIIIVHHIADLILHLLDLLLHGP